MTQNHHGKGSSCQSKSSPSHTAPQNDQLPWRGHQRIFLIHIYDRNIKLKYIWFYIHVLFKPCLQTWPTLPWPANSSTKSYFGVTGVDHRTNNTWVASRWTPWFHPHWVAATKVGPWLLSPRHMLWRPELVGVLWSLQWKFVKADLSSGVLSSWPLGTAFVLVLRRWTLYPPFASYCGTSGFESKTAWIK